MKDAGELALLGGVGVEPGLLQPAGRGGVAVAELGEVGLDVVEGQGMRPILVEHRVERRSSPRTPCRRRSCRAAIRSSWSTSRRVYPQPSQPMQVGDGEPGGDQALGPPGPRGQPGDGLPEQRVLQFAESPLEVAGRPLDPFQAVQDEEMPPAVDQHLGEPVEQSGAGRFGLQPAAEVAVRLPQEIAHILVDVETPDE